MPVSARQIKKKMTREEFIRNNRGINGPKDAPVDLPTDFLGGLYDAFSKKAIRFPQLPNGPPAAPYSSGTDPTVVKCVRNPQTAVHILRFMANKGTPQQDKSSMCYLTKTCSEVFQD